MDTPTPLALRIYRGRENGLMVIGSAESLNQLGTQLLAAADAPPNAAIPAWPQSVATPQVTGPYSDDLGFKLSFHVSETGSLPASLKLVRRGPPSLFYIAIVFLASIGIIAIFTWLLPLVL